MSSAAECSTGPSTAFCSRACASCTTRQRTCMAYSRVAGIMCGSTATLTLRYACSLAFIVFFHAIWIASLDSLLRLHSCRLWGHGSDHVLLLGRVASAFVVHRRVPRLVAKRDASLLCNRHRGRTAYLLEDRSKLLCMVGSLMILLWVIVCI